MRAICNELKTATRAPQMTPYDMIKAQLSTIVPFQNHVGVTLPGLVARQNQLAQRDEVTITSILCTQVR
jgi:hypothetical protein